MDYDVGFNSTGNWGNYTRTFPAGIYYCYMRGADGIGAVSDSASLWLVTSGQSTTNQTTSRLGTFAVPATGNWQAYTWVPLKDSGGNLIAITNSGGVKTFRVTTDSGNYNANFYLLVPVYKRPPSVPVTANNNGGGLNLSFPTLPGYSYQVEYATNLNGALWLPLGTPIAGNGSTQFVSDTPVNNRFYRVRIQ